MGNTTVPPRPYNLGGGVSLKSPKAIPKSIYDTEYFKEQGITQDILHEYKEDEFPEAFDFRNIPQAMAKRVDKEKLAQGITEFKDLTGYISKRGGIKVLKHKKIAPSRLRVERAGRIGATGASVLLSTISAIGLFTAGGKLLFNTLRGNDVDDSYHLLGKAYSGAAFAGALNGASHESLSWMVGALGQGLSSGYVGLNNILGLSLFSMSDGLQAIGMGQVRKRDEKNISIYADSIFNNPNLSFLRIFTPVEQAVKNFLRNFHDVKKIKNDEPYSLFEMAGGGLVSGGAVLGLASLFKNKMSETVQNLFYLPYSLLSAVNFIAFFRDGSSVLKREKEFKGRKPMEGFLMRTEGWSKRASAPILGLNTLMLGLKGIGLDLSGHMFDLSMAVKAFGASAAFLAFKAQSLVKFIRPNQFGPQEKEVLDVEVNPQLETPGILNLINQIENEKTDLSKSPLEDKFHKILYDKNNGLHDVIDKLIKTKEMQNLLKITQAGLPTPTNIDRINRFKYMRLPHVKRVAAVSMIVIDTLIANTKDEDIKDYLMSKRDTFIITGLLHDVGHIALSHMTEFLLEGHNNDEGSVDILTKAKEYLDDNKKEAVEIASVLKEKYGREKAIEMIGEAGKILGKGHPLSKAFKCCDYLEYVRSGDYISWGLDFPKWEIQDFIEYANNMRIVKSGKDKNGKDKLLTAYTPRGGVMAFELITDRKYGCDDTNNHPLIELEQQAYLLSLKAANLSSSEIRTSSEAKLHEYCKTKGLPNLNKANYYFTNRVKTGGEDAYQGYGAPDQEIYIIDESGKISTFEDTLSTNVDFQKRFKNKLEELKLRFRNIDTAKLIHYNIHVKTSMAS